MGQFQFSVHGEGTVEVGGALVVESSSALSVDDGGGVVGVDLGDRPEVGASREPPSELAVEVLDLAALPRRVRLAKPAIDAVSDRNGFLTEHRPSNMTNRALNQPTQQCQQQRPGTRLLRLFRLGTKVGS